jgi:uncharacterized protein (TIGR03083 family)
MVALERRLRRERADVVTADARLVARIYRGAMARVTAMVGELDDAGRNTPVAACPRWSVRDVVAHLTAVADDWGKGILTGPPTDEQTAAQIARYDDCSFDDVLANWSVAAARLDHLADTAGVEPPVGDITCHEHDIRGAIGRPGARDSDAVVHSSDRLLASLRSPVPLRVTVEDAEYRSGPAEGPELFLHTTRFEALRWRSGRRSLDQLTKMNWSGDPAPVLEHLYMFGPADHDIIE